MMYKLFYAERSAAMGVRVLLEIIGADYELIRTDITPGGPRDAALLEHNPNGWVPALTWDGGAMYECAAITIFLTDRHHEAQLAPEPQDNARGQFLQWLVYFSSSVQTAYQLTWHWDRFCADEDGRGTVNTRSVTRLREVWGIIDQSIGDQAWLAGDRLSAADIYMYMLTTWLSVDHGHPGLAEFPNVARIAAKVHEIPAVQMVYGER